MSHRRWEHLASLAAIAAVLWLYHWTVAATGSLYRPSPQVETYDYYNHLVSGFLKGHLYMDVEVPAALKALPDPYDPTQNEPHRLTDTSYFQGRYYLYFGAAPAVTLLLPYRLLTGQYLPPGWAILILTSVGFLAASATWLALRRRYFDAAPAWTAPAGILLLGVGSTAAVLLRRPYFWELATAGGFAFTMLAALALYAALHATRRAPVWMAGAGLLLGLAVASRPTYVYAVPVLAVPLVAAALIEGFTRRWWQMTVAAAAGIGLMGCAVFAYNYARFGNGFEFGHNYLLSIAYESKVRLFSLHHFWFNARMYFLLPGQWTWQPPFFAPIPVTRAEMPANFYTVDDPFGLIRVFPAVLLALFAPFALRGRNREKRLRLGAMLLVLAFLTVSAGVVILLYVATIPRYAVDFLPALALLSATGLLALTGRPRRCWQRRLRHPLAALLVVVSLVTGTLALFDVGRLMRRANPDALQRVTAVTTRLEAISDRAHGIHFGPIAVRLRMPSTPGFQTLLTAGDPARPDRVLIDVRSAGQVRLGFQHAGAAVLWSRTLPFESAATHRVGVELGSFYPPTGHGFFAGTAHAKAAWLQHRVELTFDDAVALRTFAPMDPSRRGAPTRLDSGFAGELLGIERLAPHLATREIDAPDNLWLELKDPPPPGTRLPLVASGQAAARDVLFLEGMSPGTARLGHRGRDGRIETSREFPLPAGVPHRLELRQTESGWAQPTAGQRLIVAWLDGALVWQQRVQVGASDPDDVHLGRTPAPIDGIAAEYPGGMIASTGPAPRSRRGGTLLLRVMLPHGIKGAWQPVLSTGRRGAADVLSVNYMGADVIQFRLDHWGSAMVFGRSLQIDETVGHDLEISYPSFAPDRFGQPADGEIAVRFDGEDSIRTPGSTYGFGTNEWVLGENPLRASLDDPLFRGAFISPTWTGEQPRGQPGK